VALKKRGETNYAADPEGEKKRKKGSSFHCISGTRFEGVEKKERKAKSRKKERKKGRRRREAFPGHGEPRGRGGEEEKAAP